METLRERIQFVIKEKDYSVYRLAGDDATHRVKLSRQINGETMISADTIDIVLTAFPDVSAEWLLRGEGSMIKSESEERTECVVNDSDLVESLRDQIAILKEQIALQKDFIDLLKEKKQFNMAM